MDESIEVGDMVKLHPSKWVELEIVSEKDEHGFYQARLVTSRAIISVHERSIELCQKNL